MNWQATKMVCDACGYEWAAVHPVVAEYLECPVCHHMTPAPYIEPKTMQLETINKLFLELSQVTTAETEKELLYKDALLRIRDWSKWPSNPESQEIRMIAAETLKRAQLR